MITTKVAVRLGIGVATGLLATACIGTPTASSGAITTPGSTGKAPVKQAGNTTTIVLGDLDTPVDAAAVGAPFDPCKIEWSAFPVAVRPADDRKPVLRAPGADEPFTTACRYDNSERVVIAKDPKDSKPGRNFIALIVWGKPGAMSADPANPVNNGSEPTTFAGKAGLLKSSKNKATGESVCASTVPLANGTAGVKITNGAFPDVDTCSIAKSVTEAVASKAP